MLNLIPSTDTTPIVIDSSDDASEGSSSAQASAPESPIVYTNCPASPNPEEDEYECGDEWEFELMYSNISSD